MNDRKPATAGESLLTRMREDPAFAERIYRRNPDLRPGAKPPAPSKPTERPLPKLRPPRADGFGSDTEAAYADHLRARVLAGELVSYAPHPIVYLGDGRTYTPDFVTVDPAGRVEHIDVKGKHDWEDARIKLSWARAKYPASGWRMVRGAKRGGAWEWKDVRVGGRANRTDKANPTTKEKAQ